MERLQKILSARGVCSRREAETRILAGRVTVNGRVASPGDSADSRRDKIAVDGRPLPQPEEPLYILLNKPRGVVTTLSDEKGRRTVRSLLPPSMGRVVPAGRLDLNSEGLLLMTNDGELVNSLTHPRHEVAKVYLAWVRGPVREALPVLRRPMLLDGRMTGKANIELIGEEAGAGLLRITLREGRNRQVRRMCEQAGLSVTRLKRVAEGKLELGDLKPGYWRALTEEEITYLRGI